MDLQNWKKRKIKDLNPESAKEISVAVVMLKKDQFPPMNWRVVQLIEVSKTNSWLLNSSVSRYYRLVKHMNIVVESSFSDRRLV